MAAPHHPGGEKRMIDSTGKAGAKAGVPTCPEHRSRSSSAHQPRRIRDCPLGRGQPLVRCERRELDASAAEKHVAGDE
jgi:hypothetical protein